MEFIEVFNKDRHNFEHFLQVFAKVMSERSGFIDPVFEGSSNMFFDQLPQKCRYLEMCLLPSVNGKTLEKLLCHFDTEPVHKVELLCLLSTEKRKVGNQSTINAGAETILTLPCVTRDSSLRHLFHVLTKGTLECNTMTVCFPYKWLSFCIYRDQLILNLCSSVTSSTFSFNLVYKFPTIHAELPGMFWGILLEFWWTHKALQGLGRASMNV